MVDSVNRKKRIGILTFHWADDFGAMLQAYGLKCAIEEMGYETDIIPYSNRSLSGRYWFICWTGIRDDNKQINGYWIKWKIKWNIKHFPYYFSRRWSMISFRRKRLTKKLWRKSPTHLHFKKYDGVVIGSDQVWNPEITVGIDDCYFGNFEHGQNTKVVAYSASMGKERLDDEDGKIIGRMIDENFDSVSVRESSSIPFLKEYCQKNICDMPDPTLLCNRELWEKLIHGFKSKSKYVLVYTTEKNAKLTEFANSLCGEHGLDLVNARELPIGPSEFLGFVKNAEYVVTNSFHCTVFSIIFNKNFFVFSHSDKNARLKDLLENVGLEDRISSDFSKECMPENPDWELVENNLIALRDKGRTFLMKSLEEGNK